MAAGRASNRSEACRASSSERRGRSRTASIEPGNAVPAPRFGAPRPRRRWSRAPPAAARPLLVQLRRLKYRAESRSRSSCRTGDASDLNASAKPATAYFDANTRCSRKCRSIPRRNRASGCCRSPGLHAGIDRAHGIDRAEENGLDLAFEYLRRSALERAGNDDTGRRDQCSAWPSAASQLAIAALSPGYRRCRRFPHGTRGPTIAPGGLEGARAEETSVRAITDTSSPRAALASASAAPMPLNPPVMMICAMSVPAARG